MKFTTAILGLILALTLGLAATSGCNKTGGAEPLLAEAVLDDFGPVPPFALTDQRDQAVTNATFAGKPYIVNTFFTHCRTICPPLMEKLDGLTTAVTDEDVRFLSITVDPDNDTPGALGAYAEKHTRMDPRWFFVTGPFEAIRALVVSGFKTAVGTPKPDDGADITHTAKLMLVDGRGHLRGYFSTDSEGLTALRSALESLLNRK
jgi:protein SCO1/2